jgi:hypothetical protein
MAAVNPALLNALTLNWSRQKADLDDQKNRYRINYNSALDKMRRTHADTQLRTRESLADRGMTHSGPGMAHQAKLRGELARQQAQAAQAQTTNLATVARRRLEADREYKSQKALAALGLPLK